MPHSTGVKLSRHLCFRNLRRQLPAFQEETPDLSPVHSSRLTTLNAILTCSAPLTTLTRRLPNRLPNQPLFPSPAQRLLKSDLSVPSWKRGVLLSTIMTSHFAVSTWPLSTQLSVLRSFWRSPWQSRALLTLRKPPEVPTQTLFNFREQSVFLTYLSYPGLCGAPDRWNSLLTSRNTPMLNAAGALLTTRCSFDHPTRRPSDPSHTRYYSTVPPRALVTI